jgi:hypothetical protein
MSSVARIRHPVRSRTSNMIYPVRDLDYYKPKTRAEVEIKPSDEKSFLRLTNMGVLNFTKMMRQAHVATLQDLDRKAKWWIERYVPKATGQLRRSLWKQAKSHLSYEVTRSRFRLNVGTYVPYVKYVDSMGQRNLRHNGQTRRVNYPGPRGRWRTIILQDPQASQSFFDKLIDYLREILFQRLFVNIYNFGVNQYGLNRGQMQQLFNRMPMTHENNAGLRAESNNARSGVRRSP